MLRQPRPRRPLRSLLVWSLGIGLAWLLFGQQLAGQPAIHLDLTAALPATSPVHGHQTARQVQHHQKSAPHPHTSPRSSTGTSPQTSQAFARAVTFALTQQGKPYDGARKDPVPMTAPAWSGEPGGTPAYPGNG